jgi:ATP-binding cassette subfamily F protein 3
MTGICCAQRLTNSSSSPMASCSHSMAIWTITKTGCLKPAAAAAAPSASAANADNGVAFVSKVDQKEQRRKDAEERQRLSGLRKPIENRIRKLEDQMDKAGKLKADIDRQLEDSEIYSDANKEKLKALLLDQAKLTKELEQLEGDWLEQQEALEAIV